MRLVLTDGLTGDGDSVTDTLGSKEYWCDGAMVNVTLATGSWLIGTNRCTVQNMMAVPRTRRSRTAAVLIHRR